ncbi:Membrane-associated guanylate kinase WW and PDZ domain-containing protein, partial [Fasciola gigantica]
IKHLVPGGPASITGCLDVGDVLVAVNSVNVLAYTHAEIVSLFQSIPVGSSITLTVSQAYRLRRDTNDAFTVCSTASAESAVTPSVSGNTQSGHLSISAGSAGPIVSSPSAVHSPSSRTSSPHLSLSPPISTTVGSRSHDHSTSSSEMGSSSSQATSRARGGAWTRPEFIKVAIFKQPNGFGFTLADHPQGQHVKAILDPGRCGRLRIGDVVVEINDQRVKEISHAEVVQILKQCPVGQEARLLVQRGGLYTSPFSLLTADRGSLKHSSVIADKIHLHTGSSTVPSLAIDALPGLTDQPRHRARTPSADVDRRLGSQDSTYADLTEFGALHQPNPVGQQVISDRRRRMQPSDDSALLAMGKPLGTTTMINPISPDSSLHYGSLLRPGRMPPLRNSVPVQVSSSKTGHNTGGPRAPSFLMLPGEFLVHLQRQPNGFGFTVIGGAEENSQITIGSLLPGGSAQMSGVVRTGDRLISINGLRVVGFKHREVVQLLDQAAHAVGQVTLGLQRPKQNTMGSIILFCIYMHTKAPLSPFNWLLKIALLLIYAFPAHTHFCFARGIPAQLVPGSKAERLGLLSVGDRILAVNKIPVSGVHHDQVVRLIRESGSHIVLTIIPSPASPWASRFQAVPEPGGAAVEFPVTLFRGSRGFGFSIRGGQEFNRMPLLVLRIADGGAAQMDGRLRVGDELIEINGYPTVGMSHGRAIEIIQAGGNTMQLIVRRRTGSSSKKEFMNTDRYHRRIVCPEEQFEDE